jgi:mitochondrial cardiolipin hydrolase
MLFAHKTSCDNENMKKLHQLLYVILSLVSNHFSYGFSIETFFAPDDRPTTRLIKEINETTDKIFAAIYYISDQKIIDALIHAHNRGVNVRIISDEQTSNTIYSKVGQLLASGIPVFIPKPHVGKVNWKGFVRHRLMHDKFAILNGKIWTGSFNWTLGANVFNFENVVIIDHEETYKKFLERYFEIERQCSPYQPLQKSLHFVRIALAYPLILEQTQLSQVC